MIIKAIRDNSATGKLHRYTIKSGKENIVSGAIYLNEDVKVPCVLLIQVLDSKDVISIENNEG